MGRTCNLVRLAGFALVAGIAYGGCPFLSSQEDQQLLDNHIGGEGLLSTGSSCEERADYSRETYEAIKADILVVFVDPRDFWPADFGNYARLMIRLA
ncbi:unnamed protein product [Ectocarpus sp. CCAP 1310/34]|nr:unnamed protein product [Ectocarpus sp. CCAP 1310/34]